jgi:hypothetical protein
MHKAAEIFVKLAKLPQFIPADDQGHYLRNVLTGSRVWQMRFGDAHGLMLTWPGKSTGPESNQVVKRDADLDKLLNAMELQALSLRPR